MTEDELIERFGERLRSERVRLKLTQQELAQMTGVKQQTIFKYEKGLTFPTISFIYSLRKFEFNTQYLFSGSIAVPNPNDIPKEVFQFVVDMVSKIEREFSNTPLSNETKLRILLILLGQYVESPASLPLTETQFIDLLVKS